MTEPYYDVIGFSWYINEDGIREYGCRGTGPRYDKFYHEWIKDSSYRCIRVDFPWDIFVFDNPEDHDRLVKDFPNDVYEEEEDEEEDEDE